MVSTPESTITAPASHATGSAHIAQRLSPVAAASRVHTASSSKSVHSGRGAEHGFAQENPHARERLRQRPERRKRKHPLQDTAALPVRREPGRARAYERAQQARERRGVHGLSGYRGIQDFAQREQGGERRAPGAGTYGHAPAPPPPISFPSRKQDRRLPANTAVPAGAVWPYSSRYSAGRMAVPLACSTSAARVERRVRQRALARGALEQLAERIHFIIVTQQVGSGRCRAPLQRAG